MRSIAVLMMIIAILNCNCSGIDTVSDYMIRNELGVELLDVQVEYWTDAWNVMDIGDIPAFSQTAVYSIDNYFLHLYFSIGAIRCKTNDYLLDRGGLTVIVIDDNTNVYQLGE